MPDPQERWSLNVVAYFLPTLVYAISSYLVWQGLGYWDSIHYVGAALDLLEDGPSLGEKHWDLRYPMVLPIAASLSIFGTSEFAASVPSFIYGICLVLVSTAFGIRHLGTVAGTLFGMLLAASVSLVLLPLAIEIRGPEIFFVALSFWLFISATQNALSAPLLIGSGVAAAFALLCREVSAYVLPTIVVASLLFLPKDQWRRAILLPATGFLATIAGELAFYFMSSGDPLYRYRISLIHNEISSGSAKELAIGLREQGFLETVGTPILGYLSAQSTMPLAILGGLAGISLIFLRRPLSTTTHLALGVFATAAVLSYLLAALVLNLQSPRYYPVLDYLACLLIAVAVSNFGLLGWRKLVLLPVIAVIASAPFAADATRGFLFEGARPAAQAAKVEAEPLIASKWHRERAMMLLRLDGWTSEAAFAEFMIDSEDNRNGLYYVVEEKFPCEQDTENCDFVLVRDLGEMKLSWGQNVRASLCKTVPSISEYLCNWGSRASALYRRRDAVQ